MIIGTLLAALIAVFESFQGDAMASLEASLIAAIGLAICLADDEMRGLE